ncbi:MAG: hypothetical protein ABID63_11415 [Pseudomonadota bacterium]
MIRSLQILCIVLACVWNGHALAQSTETSGWVRMPGTAVDISINADGQAYVVSPEGTPWRWDKVEQRWRRMSGNFVRITAAIGNRPWAIDPKGVVFLYNGLWWENKGTDVADVAADTNGNVYIVKTSGDIQKWYGLRSEWQPIEGTAKRIALDGAGQPWIITPDNGIRSFDGENWAALPGFARDIALGGTDVVAISDADGRVRIWNAGQRRWIVVDGVRDASAIGITPEGKIWAIVNDGAIMANGELVSEETNRDEEDAATNPRAIVQEAPTNVAPDILTSVPAATTPAAPPAEAQPVTTTETAQTAPQNTSRATNASTGFIDPVTITTKDRITFINTLKTATALAIGADGSVFGLDNGSNILRWSNQKKAFDSFPGSLVRIAVDPEGNPWGISALGRVFRHTGSQWKQIPNATASDIAIGFDDTVLTANSAGRLFRLNAAQTRFEMIPASNITLIAAGPDGTPWVVRQDKLVQRCDVSPCKVYPQKAVSIAVGPDGSVYIVSDINRLMRLDSDDRFQIIQTPGHTPAKVAVGPMGFPWVVSTDDIVLASSYFERDESNDRIEAASTSESGTTGTGSTETVVNTTVSSFTFSKNMRFETVSAPGLSPGFPASLTSDSDGVVWFWDGYGTVEKYSASRRQFIDAKTQLAVNRDNIQNMDIAPNDDIWAYVQNLQEPARLYRERNRVLKEYNISGASAAGVAASPDGTIFAIFDFGAIQQLYSKKANSETFTRFSNDTNVFLLSVGPGSDVWIVDDSKDVKQWTGSKFEKRPASGQKASAIAVGKKDGTVYIKDPDDGLMKWNATNRSFDKVNNVTASSIAVDGDGRPWISIVNPLTEIRRGRD